MANKPQTEEEKKRLREAAEALFMELDAEFGKKPKGLAVRTVKAKNAELKPQVMSEGAQANKLAMLLGENTIWKPVARIAHIVTQHCKCCGGETELIGNSLIRFEHKLRKHKWDVSVPPSHAFAMLPQEVQAHDMYIDECPTCVRYNMHSMPVEAENVQLKLFQ